MKLSAIFKKWLRKDIPPIDDEFIPFFWEDDYCQVELLPYENRPYLLKEIANISGFSEDHSDGGNGFTELYMRGDMPFPLATKELRRDYFLALLERNGLRPPARVRMGDMVCRVEELKGMDVHGVPGFTVFFEHNCDLVKCAWITLWDLTRAQDQLEGVINFFYQLGEECGLVLVDWSSLEIVDITDRNEIASYLST